MFKPKTGSLLIAEPFLKDPNFSRTVIFLCQHLPEGSFGLVVNKVLTLSINDVMDNVKNNKFKLYYGGPVQLDTVHFLHKKPSLIPGSSKVADGIYWGGDFDTVISLINDNLLNADDIRFYLGYSGWEKDQLKEEMEISNTWLAVDAKPKLVFTNNTEELWKDAITELGDAFKLFKNYPIDPQLN
jgi:putative transcriptional regulator